MSKVKTAKPISKKRKFVKDGVFYAELNDFLARELAENGYAGCEIRVTPKRTEITIRATQVLQVVGDNGRRIRELTALIQKRFQFPRKGLFMYAEKIPNKGLSALAQAQAVKFRLLQGLSVRRAAYSVVQFIMNKGAKGCEVIVSGKLRGQRAKAMKFRDGYMIHAGDAINYYIDTAVKHVHLRQGVIGIKVKIMLPHDPTGLRGVAKDLPDSIKIHEPVEPKEPTPEIPVDLPEEQSQQQPNEEEEEVLNNEQEQQPEQGQGQEQKKEQGQPEEPNNDGNGNFENPENNFGNFDQQPPQQQNFNEFPSY